MTLEASNLYIPKYILDVPWYYKMTQNFENSSNFETIDTLAHHRKHPGQNRVDHSEPQAGTGISDDTIEINGTKTRLVDDYDAKRDRWYGYSADEWSEILEKWEKVGSNKKPPQNSSQNDDSDDTDYELELEELGLTRMELKMNHIEDPLEKTIRDRRDIPQYIMAINSNQGGKIRLGKDSTIGIISDNSEFVKESSDVKEFKKMQKFAWEKNQEFEAQQQKRQYQAHLVSLSDPNKVVEKKPVIDLNLNMEASPTIMMLKNRQNEAKQKRASDEKRRKLMQMYGS